MLSLSSQRLSFVSGAQRLIIKKIITPTVNNLQCKNYLCTSQENNIQSNLFSNSTNSQNIKILWNNNNLRYLSFGQQHDQLRETVRKIIDKDINPYVDEWEKEEQFPSHKIFKILGDAGLLGLTRDPEYGGQGLDYSFSVAFFEELARINCGGIPAGITVQTDMATPALANYGSDKLKRLFLEPTLKGDFVASIAVSEPSGGSDVAAIKTNAKRDGDDYIINGSKMWITNGVKCDFAVVLVNTSNDHPHKNKSLICVPKSEKGFTVGKPIKKMGLKSSDTALLFFEDVRVPIDYRIGDEGMGFIYQMLQFVDERVCAAICAVGQMERLLDETIDYCKQRHTFGQPIIDNQYVHFRLAELKSDIESLKSLSYRIADTIIEGKTESHGSQAAMLSAIVKLKAARLLREVADSCLQYFGGMGYSSDLLVERAYRDARILSIAGGADEIMLGIICKFMNILPRKKT